VRDSSRVIERERADWPRPFVGVPPAVIDCGHSRVARARILSTNPGGARQDPGITRREDFAADVVPIAILSRTSPARVVSHASRLPGGKMVGRD